MKLYRFWESIEDAPREIQAIKEDLQYLSSVFGKLDSDQAKLGKCVVEGTKHCKDKVAVRLD